ESPHPDREDPELPAAGRSRGKVSKKGSRQIEDWESGLESFGVAKCGVCGMKFPLDVGAIEKHSLECEAAQKEGRRPARSDSISVPDLGQVASAPRDRAASLRSKLAAAGAGYAGQPSR
ncbi:unnamed protein product, partial [Polarella glacialis]